MAFDYGSIDLGIKNPFKQEGRATAIRGVLQILIAIPLLFIAASQVKSEPTTGWVLLIFGAFILFSGIVALSGGSFALLRFFVGRNHPTSLSRNFSKSGTASSTENEPVAYKTATLENMLIGRENPTFVEPRGFIARLLHSVFSKLLFMPYPIRNKAQSLFNAWVSTLTVLISYSIVAFICFSGFAGDKGERLFPIYSALALIYVLFTWTLASSAMPRKVQTSVENIGGKSFAKIIILSIVLPLIAGIASSDVIVRLEEISISPNQSMPLFDYFPSFSPFLYILGIIALGAICTFIIVVMLRYRVQHTNPKTEVSELRENWQESVHPKEIFINLDNLVMANHRYKEVPNRVYRELNPDLQEQVSGKGSFDGVILQEVQPTVSPMDLGAKFNLFRLISLYMGNVFYVVATLLFVWMAYSLIDAIHIFDPESMQAVKAHSDTLQGDVRDAFMTQYIVDLGDTVISVVALLLIASIMTIFARLLVNVAHLFYAEIQFKSLLVYFKCEGTFTESKISTGTGIHDSTRSENTLVRSSITPWVVVTNIISSTFAAYGMKNLEYPRYILEMHKADDKLAEIREDVIKFLKDRESIASITSTRDLENTANIHSINQQTRAIPSINQNQLTLDEEAASHVQNQKELDDKANNPN